MGNIYEQMKTGIRHDDTQTMFAKPPTPTDIIQAWIFKSDPMGNWSSSIRLANTFYCYICTKLAVEMKCGCNPSLVCEHPIVIRCVKGITARDA